MYERCTPYITQQNAELENPSWVIHILANCDFILDLGNQECVISEETLIDGLTEQKYKVHKYNQPIFDKDTLPPSDPSLPSFPSFLPPLKNFHSTEDSKNYPHYRHQLLVMNATSTFK